MWCSIQVTEPNRDYWESGLPYSMDAVLRAGWGAWQALTQRAEDALTPDDGTTVDLTGEYAIARWAPLEACGIRLADGGHTIAWLYALHERYMSRQTHHMVFPEDRLPILYRYAMGELI